MTQLFARRVFTVAGIYGLVVLVPFYFLERWLGENRPPAITHAEFYYGFAGVAVAWQVAFLIIGRDPVRYRLLMLPAILAKDLRDRGADVVRFESPRGKLVGRGRRGSGIGGAVREGVPEDWWNFPITPDAFRRDRVRVSSGGHARVSALLPSRNVCDNLLEWVAELRPYLATKQRVFVAHL